MPRPKIQFSLLAMLLFVTIVALILALSLRLPSGHFELDSSSCGSVSDRDIAIRLAVITPLAIAEFAGILLIVRIYRRRRRRL